MRYDMAKVLVERPRRGHGESYKPIRRRENRGDPESLPGKDSMRRPHLKGWGGKEFSDHIMPLKRYLESQIGRKWDDVFSEISAQIRGNGTVQRHILQHVFGFINTKVVRLDDGSLEDRDGRPFFDLYVDPDDKIIRHNPKTRTSWKHKKETDPNRRVFGLEYETFKVNGCWHRVFFADAPGPYVNRDPITRKETVINQYAYDVVTGDQVSVGRYRAVTRQLDSKTLRRLGLTNDIEAA